MRLLVVAPEFLWDRLSDGLRLICSDIRLIPRPKPTTSSDPYKLSQIARAASPTFDSILLIAPCRRSANRLVPAPVVHGIPIGIVYADSVFQLEDWLRAMLTTRRRVQNKVWIVLAMWKPCYLVWGGRFAQWMKAGVNGRNIKVQTWFADAISRDDLCMQLANGPQLTIYVGHGRARGWSGYRGVRWEHIATTKLKKPCGVLISFACDTLKRTRGIDPFGCRWVSTGRACSYVGSVDRLGYEVNAAFAYELGQILAQSRCRSIGELLQQVYCRLEQRADLTRARRAFNSYRLIGNPLQPLF